MDNSLQSGDCLNESSENLWISKFHFPHVRQTTRKSVILSGITGFHRVHHRFHILRASAGIPIIFMTSLMRASLSSTKLFMIRVKGQMKTKTSGQSRCEILGDHLDFTRISPEFRVQRGSFSKCVWLKLIWKATSGFYSHVCCSFISLSTAFMIIKVIFPNETNSIQWPDDGFKTSHISV